MSDLKSRLNIHGIIDLDQMAAVLTSLIEQVDRQNRVIGDLQKSLSLYVTNQSFIERVTNLENIVAKSNVKIDAIQEATTATVLNKKYGLLFYLSHICIIYLYYSTTLVVCFLEFLRGIWHLQITSRSISCLNWCLSVPQNSS